LCYEGNNVNEFKKVSYKNMEKIEANHPLESVEVNVPQVEFELANVEREADLFDDFIKRNNWPHIFAKHQELVDLLNGVEDKEKRKAICLEYVRKLRSEHEAEMKTFSEEIKNEWDKINEKFLEILSVHFETDWPAEEKITGYVSTLPIHPRFIDFNSFFIGYENLSAMIETSAHEIVHFLWFKKWKEVFPEVERREYERPNLVWKLSEIMDPIILQCHPEIKEMIKPRQWGYRSFTTKKIGEVGMTEYFKKIYLDSVSSGDSFDVTLKKLWEEAKLHEAEIGDI
jgi:hypothetical protein